MDIPVYVISGFLNSGKTTFINGMLRDGFARNDRTLFIRCEEGEEEYSYQDKDKLAVVTVEKETDLKRSFFKQCEKAHRPKQIVIEFNGMWPMERLYKGALPANWIIFQTMTLVEAPTFELYAKNMGQIMMEKIINCDILMFNRCTPALKDALRKRNLRMANRQASIYLENVDGSKENYLTGDECPFDLDRLVIDIPDNDFGVWYVDLLDHPWRYSGKKVHLKMVMCHPPNFPSVTYPGRFAMVCCENDVTFLGLIAKGEGLDRYKDYDWVEITAEMAVEKEAGYNDKEGPVMHILTIAPCKKAAQEVVSF